MKVGSSEEQMASGSVTWSQEQGLKPYEPEAMACA